MQPIHLELHSEIDEYEEHQLANQRMDVLKNDHILGFSEMLKTSLTSWNSFNVCFAILFTLGCTWPTIPKAYATVADLEFTRPQIFGLPHPLSVTLEVQTEYFEATLGLVKCLEISKELIRECVICLVVVAACHSCIII